MIPICRFLGPLFPVSAALWAATVCSAAEPLAEITIVAGGAEVVRADTRRTEPAARDMELYVGDTVRTRYDGKVEILFDQGTLLRLGENTEVRLQQTEDQNGVFVAIGRLWARIKKLFGRSKFEVETPAAVAGVRGTTLRVDVRADGESTVAVDEGEAEVIVGDRRERLRSAWQAVCARQAIQTARFTPKQRRPWEFWTDPIVRERLDETGTGADECRVEAQSCVERAKELGKSLRASIEGAGRLLARCGEMEKQLATLPGRMEALREARQALERNRLRMPPAKVEAERIRIARETQTVRQEGSALVREYLSVQQALRRGRQEAEARRQALSDFLTRAAALRARQATLQQGIDRIRAVRSLDPHWGEFRSLHEASRADCRAAGEDADRAANMADDQPFQPGAKPRTVRQHVLALQAALDSVEGVLAAHRQPLDRVQGSLEQLPPPDPTTAPAPRRPRRGRPGR